MQKRKQYTWYFIAVVLLVFYISFFYMERTEINDVDLLLVVGIDKEAEGYHVSAIYNKDGGTDDATGGAQVIDGRGATFYEAYQDLVQKNLKSVSIAHTTFFIFGEGAAKSGMSQCLDYIEREQTVKMDAIVYLLKDMSVYDFMQKTIEDETQFSEELNAINEKQLDEKKVVDNTIGKVTEKLEDNTQNLFVPYLVSDEDYLYLNGYGVIKDDSLVAFLDREQSMTLDFLRNRLRTYPIYLSDGIGLEITDSNVAREVQLVNGALTVRLNINFESDIKEVTTEDSVYEDYYVQQLIYLQNEYMSEQIANLLKVSEEYKFDVVEIGKLIRNTYINDWNSISSDWNYYLSNISYQYSITSQTAQSYVVAS